MTKYLQYYFYEKRGCLFGHPLFKLDSVSVIGSSGLLPSAMSNRTSKSLNRICPNPFRPMARISLDSKLPLSAQAILFCTHQLLLESLPQAIRGFALKKNMND